MVAQPRQPAHVTRLCLGVTLDSVTHTIDLMLADLAPTLAHALAPVSPAKTRFADCHRTPEFDAYVRDAVKIFHLWHCSEAIREEVFKVVLLHRTFTFGVGISAGDPVALTKAFGLTAYDMCAGLFLGERPQQAHLLDAHKSALCCPSPVAVQHHVKLFPPLGLDVCSITPYSGYWALVPCPPKRNRDGDTLPATKRPVLVTNLDEAHDVANTWVGENTDPVEAVSFIRVLELLRSGA